VISLKFGYPECLLIFSSVLSFHSVEKSLFIALLSCIFAFFRFSLESNEKKERKEKIENSESLLHDQVKEFNKAISSTLETLSKNLKTSEEKNILLNRGKFDSTIQ
jgi:hypothetical protein